MGVCLPCINGGRLEHAILPSLLGTDSPIILEIGCNNAVDTLEMARQFISPTVHCFEPDPRAYAAACESTAGWDCVTVHNTAIAACDGQSEFYPSTGAFAGVSDWTASGSLRRPSAHQLLHPGIRFKKSINVEVRRLDTWVKEHGIELIDFVWMDVQGAEADVIEGALEVLPQIRFVYTEYSDLELYEGQSDLKSIAAMLSGFRIRRRYIHDVLFENTRL